MSELSSRFEGLTPDHRDPLGAPLLARRAEVIARIQSFLRRRGPSALHVGPLREAAALAERLCALAGPSFAVALLATSDGDALDNALKLARAATGRRRLLACPGPRLARSFGALSLMPGAPGALGALIEGCEVRSPADAAASLRGAAALLIEPVDEALCPLPRATLLDLERRCREAGALLIVDETATGLGRCGRYFAFQAAGLRPDAVVVGQGLGAGAMAIAATLVTPEAHRRAFARPETFDLHTATMAGNAAACEAALGLLDVLEREQLPTRAERLGALLREALGPAHRVEGVGLLLAIDGRRFAPPLDASDEQILALAAALRR